MKKFFSNFVALIVAFASVLLGFSFAEQKNVAYGQEQTSSSQILENVIMSQDGHVFDRTDFEQKNGEFYLYVNTTITISKIGTGSLTITYGNSIETATIQNGEHHVVSYNASAGETKKYLILHLNSLPSSGENEFRFHLVQTPNHYKVNPSFYWTDNTTPTPKTISAPFNVNQKFNEYLTLKNIAGTSDCPVYIDIYYNNEFYSIYNKPDSNNNSKFYSSITGNELNINPDDGIRFNAAGTYEIYVYDKTAYGSMKHVEIDKNLFPTATKPSSNVSFYMLNLDTIDNLQFANIQGYAFTIQNTPKNDMYITATDADGNSVLDGQVANTDVKLSLHNLSTTLIGQITLTTIKYGSPRTTVPIAGYDSDVSIRDIEADGLTFDEDGTYIIQFYNKNGKIIKPAYKNTDGSEYEDSDVDEDAAMFSFRLIKDIQTSYQDIMVSTVNKIETFELKSVIVRWLTCTKEKVNTKNNEYEWQFLKGVNPYNFTVRIAKPEVKISGVSNGESANTDLKLTVSGVGKIEVVVTRDTTTNVYSLNNGDTVPDTATVGNYTVTMTDQMGNTMTVNFSVKQALNTATIVLIIVV